MPSTAFLLYLLFVSSWFLHLTARIPLLGALRFDLLVAVAIVMCMIPGLPGQREARGTGGSPLPKMLGVLIAYALIATPFVQWPGSVVRAGLPLFVKSIVFYYFTVTLVTNRRRLGWLMCVFVASQAFRVLEPAYLHLTTGYWGSSAFMDWDGRLDRLSGSPFDIVNPNGLAFVILTVLPFAHYLAPLTRLGTAAYLAVLPVLVYALVLTGSRSGALAFLVVLALIWVRARRKLLVGVLVLAAALLTLPYVSTDLADRYLSIVSADTRNGRTASGRIAAEFEAFAIAARRPLLGHGLGTSRETNANFADADMPAHILYGEVAQELGYVGLAIYVVFLGAVFVNVSRAGQLLREQPDPDELYVRVWLGLRVWLWMNLAFSFASYGLSEYEWYFAAGLSDVLRRAAAGAGERVAPVAPRPAAPMPSIRLAGLRAR